MKKTLLSLVKSYDQFFVTVLLIGVVTFLPVLSQAQPASDQDEIILLNDSAAALEDSDLGLSKSLTKFADEKEKEWENNSANKNQVPVPVTKKDIPQIQDRIKLLKAAALAIEPVYPLIAQGLNKMAKEMDKAIELVE